MDIGQCPTKIKICPAKRKIHRTFCPTRKTRGKIKYPTRLCLYPTINWRYPTKLLILCNKYLSNKSFQINKLQYPKYSFYRKLIMKGFKEIYSKEFVFTSSSPKKKKNHWIQNDLIFSICEQFLIPLKEAEMKWSISDF